MLGAPRSRRTLCDALFWMADDIQQVTGVLFDLVVEAPSLIDSCLPHSPSKNPQPLLSAKDEKDSQRVDEVLSSFFSGSQKALPCSSY